MGEGDDDLLFGDEVLGGQVQRGVGRDLVATVVAVFLGDLVHFLLDQHPHLLVGGKDRLQVGDQLDDLFVLLLDLVALELGEAPQRHIQDGLRLPLS